MCRSRLAGLPLALLFVALSLGIAQAQGYVEKDLVVGGQNAVEATKTLKDANGITHRANFFDKNLVNSWGLTEIPTGSPFWISDNGVGLSTLYSVNPSPPTPPQGQPQARVVSIPTPDPSAKFGFPTGVVWNPTMGQEFKIKGFLFTSQPTKCSNTFAPATFLWATEDGTVVGWNSNLYPTLGACMNGTAGGNNSGIITPINNFGGGKGAVYKGLAIATVGTTAYLYVANFRAGTVEKYDGAFNLLDSFTDPNLPPNQNYAPFNIVPITVNGKVELFVTFAVQILLDSTTIKRAQGMALWTPWILPPRINCSVSPSTARSTRRGAWRSRRLASVNWAGRY